MSSPAVTTGAALEIFRWASALRILWGPWDERTVGWMRDGGGEMNHLFYWNHSVEMNQLLIVLLIMFVLIDRRFIKFYEPFIVY